MRCDRRWYTVPRSVQNHRTDTAIQIVSHLHQSKPLDDFLQMDSIAKITTLETSLVGKAHPNHDLSTIVAYIPTLRSLANTLLEKTKLSPLVPLVFNLLERCQQVDATLLRWTNNIPETWKYTTVELTETISNCQGHLPSRPRPGRIDVYADVWIARTWNSYRTARLYVQAIILRCVAWLSEMPVAELTHRNTDPALRVTATRTRDTLQEMVDGVCASVPSHGFGQIDNSDPLSLCLRSYALDSLSTFGSVVGPSDYSQSDTSTVPSGSHESDGLHEIGGYLLLWPLLVARSTFFIPEGQKKWILSKVFEIAQHAGLNEAIMTRINRKPRHPLFEA